MNINLLSFSNNRKSSHICVKYGSEDVYTAGDQLDEPLAIVDGYTSYFSFSRMKSGYSGVATFVKDQATPFKAEEGLTGLLAAESDDIIGCYGDQTGFTHDELISLDNEGRAILTQHKLRSNNASVMEEIMTVINVYCPRADPEKAERKDYKMQFYKLLQIRAEALLKKGHVIVLGDVNTSHKRIDHCDPSEEKSFEEHPGRRWLNSFTCEPSKLNTLCMSIEISNISPSKIDDPPGGLFVDTFRLFHPEQKAAYTCWSTVTGARATNYGVRLDYIFADIGLCKQGLNDCIIMPEVEGSDHCPVKASMELKPISSSKCPRTAAKWMPEFAGKQKKLSDFFSKSTNQISIEDSSSSKLSNANQSRTNASDRNMQSQLKRKTSPIHSEKAKKIKSDRGNKVGIKKQGSVLAFFGKKDNSESTNIKSCKKDESHTTTNSDNGMCYSSQGSSQPDSVDTKTEIASSWKALLKGPPSAPLCNGHKEPCLLRTVKKDSLNKGRQFWVCPRPEGHKTNPEARCEHFEWISKKNIIKT